MTDQEIDAMEAGRGMDIQVAKQAMTHMEPFALWHVACPDGKTGCGVLHQDWFDANKVRIPRYSTDIAAAWLVVEKLTCTTKQWFHYEQSSTTCTAIFQNDAYAGYDAEAEAETAPLAICRAALRAMIGVEVVPIRKVR